MQEHGYTVSYQNPQANAPLQIAVTSNVLLDDINRNVAINAARDYNWFACRDGFSDEAIIVGGGPSLKDELETLKGLAEEAEVIAVNGAAGFLSKNGIDVDYQFMMDARPENAALIDINAQNFLLASQCHPDVINLVPSYRLELVHLNSPDIEDQFPPHKRDRGGYTLVGGAASVGNSALCLAHAMGFRKLHVFGFDSSVRGDDRHAYEQALNKDEQLIAMRFGDRAYWLSYTMAVQVEYFFVIEEELKKLGTEIEVYGDGLLPAKWRKKRETEAMTEAQKYELIWSHPQYGFLSPAEQIVEAIDGWLPPGSEVLDLGCGAGRAAVELTRRGHTVTLIDFVENSRDDAALSLPFVKGDLSQTIPTNAPYGYCCDVMEHIPPDQVSAVLENIAQACEKVLFRIEFEPDGFGPALLGTPLHLSVHDDVWWSEELARHFSIVRYVGNGVYHVEND